MHEMDLLQDLAVILVIAGAITVLFHRLRQPVVLGYIVAGMIVGPHTPPALLIRDERSIALLADLGVILLMFSLGQHFSLRKVKSVGATAVLGALLEIAVMGWCGFELGHAFGWSRMDSVFLGALLSMSSTTIIVKALGDLGLLHERASQLIFGILIIEDILGIAMIALLSGLATTGSLDVAEVGRTLGGLALFLVGVIVVGLLTVPRLLGYVARFRSGEMLLVAVLGVCFGGALLAARFGYSVALGAFLAGAIVAEARDSRRIEALVEPVRDMFSAVFFVAIGMLIDPRLMLEQWLPIAVITAVLIVGKVLACGTGAFLAGNDRRTSVRVGMGIAQIGEFSFIIAQLGVSLGVTSRFLYPIVVAVSAVTTLLTPYLIRAADPLARTLERRLPRPLLDWLDVYARWIGRVMGAANSDDVRARRRILVRLTFQIVLDLALVMAAFVLAGILVRRLPFDPPPWLGGRRAALWTAACVVALPALVHGFGKLCALATILAELGVRPLTDARTMPRARAVVATMLLAIGSVLALTALIAVSVALLPPWPVLVLLCVGFVIVVATLWRRLAAIYAQAQATLRETFAHADRRDEGQRHLETILEDAILDTVEIPRASPVAGSLIRQLQLRSRTGASIVGIRRGDRNLINPGPDEEVHGGDRVLLLGTRDHVDAARRALLPA